MRRWPAVLGLAVLLGGCAMPGWVPWLGSSKKGAAPAGARAPAAPEPARDEAPKDPRPRPPRTASADGDEIADRVVAVVNNDAITLGELQDAIVSFRQENRQRAGEGPSDEQLSQEFLNRLIENRLQLQEADREKVTVDENEVNEEFNERIKRYGVTTQEEFEKLIKPQGLTLEAIKKKMREALRINKVVRRKVTRRISVTDEEIARYLDENRTKLETGLGYHARHILVVPEAGAPDAAWEAARIKADLLYTQLTGGADFAELARQHSRDATARDGGDLGTLKRGELAGEIESVILALRPGEISRPYKSELGYHIFRLESKESLEGDGLQRVQQQIRDILFRQKYEARLEAWLKEIRGRAIIEVRL